MPHFYIYFEAKQNSSTLSADQHVLRLTRKRRIFSIKKKRKEKKKERKKLNLMLCKLLN